MANNTLPPDGNFSILQKVTTIYLLWHNYSSQLPKSTRYSLGAKVDILFTDLLEIILQARYANKENKLSFIDKATIKLDLLKFFLQIIWQTKSLDSKKYLQLSEPLSEIGKILGGWKKSF